MSFEEEIWPSILDNLTEKLKKINLPHQVANTKTFEGKISKVMENLTIRKKIATYISKCAEVHHNKSGATASRLRDQGNEKFKHKDNAGALKLYTESIICAPEYGPELSLAYANRSATFFDMGEYRAALKDVEMALKNKYPRNLEYKIMQRQAQCLIRIGCYNDALEVLNSFDKSVESAKLTEEKKGSVIRDVNAMRQELEGLLKRRPSGERQSEEKQYPELVNNSLPYASPKLVLQTSEDKIRGRFVTTTEDVQEGEIVFSEDPYSSVLLPDQYSSHCHHCYKRLSAPVPCKKCTQPRYCSDECVEAAWNYHQHECGQLDLLHSIGIGHLALRTILVTGLDKLEDVRKAVRNGCYSCSNEDEYSRVYSLLHHVDKMQEDEVFQYTVTAALLATFLAKKTKFIFATRSPNSPSLSPDDTEDDDLVYYLGGLILRHLCQLVGNAHAITDLREKDNGDVQQVRLATAIYPSVSMMNHSCVATIANQFYGRRLVVRAIRQLRTGDEVTNCYGPDYRRHSYQERQEMLLSQYKFRCLCTACTDSKEKNFTRRYKANKCDKCDGPVIDDTCNDCDTTVKLPLNYDDEISNIVGQILQLDIHKDYHGLTGQETKIQLEHMENCEKKLSQMLYKHNSHLAKVRDMLAKAYSNAGEYKKAANISRQSLNSTVERFGPKSVEVGHELLKLTDLIFAQMEVQKCEVDENFLLESLIQARDIFEFNYGAACKYCAELNHKISVLKPV